MNRIATRKKHQLRRGRGPVPTGNIPTEPVLIFIGKGWIFSVNNPTTQYSHRFGEFSVFLLNSEGGMASSLRVKILTVSDSAAEGRRTDRSGKALRQILEKIGWVVLKNEVLPDETEAVRQCLRAWSQESELDLILTTGGTGLGPGHNSRGNSALART